MSPLSVIISTGAVYIIVKGRLPVYAKLLTEGVATGAVTTAADKAPGVAKQVMDFANGPGLDQFFK